MAGLMVVNLAGQSAEKRAAPKAVRSDPLPAAAYCELCAKSVMFQIIYKIQQRKRLPLLVSETSRLFRCNVLGEAIALAPPIARVRLSPIITR